MNQVLIHTFQDTIGPGPYRFVGTYDMGAALAHQQSFGDTAAAFRDAPRLEAGLGTCAHCGQAILNICIVRRGDGKLYGVGQDCILKIGDKKLVDAVKLERNRVAREKRAAKREVARLARLQEQRDRNGGLTDYELAEQHRKQREDAELARKLPVIDALEIYASLLADGQGGFRDSVALDMRRGDIPKGRGFDIMLDILAKQAGRGGSNAYKARHAELAAEFERIENIKG